jgi:hypothetical protein
MEQESPLSRAKFFLAYTQACTGNHNVYAIDQRETHRGAPPHRRGTAVSSWHGVVWRHELTMVGRPEGPHVAFR